MTVRPDVVYEQAGQGDLSKDYLTPKRQFGGYSHNS